MEITIKQFQNSDEIVKVSFERNHQSSDFFQTMMQMETKSFLVQITLSDMNKSQLFFLQSGRNSTNDPIFNLLKSFREDIKLPVTRLFSEMEVHKNQIKQNGLIFLHSLHSNIYFHSSVDVNEIKTVSGRNKVF